MEPNVFKSGGWMNEWLQKPGQHESFSFLLYIQLSLPLSASPELVMNYWPLKILLWFSFCHCWKVELVTVTSATARTISTSTLSLSTVKSNITLIHEPITGELQHCYSPTIETSSDVFVNEWIMEALLWLIFRRMDYPSKFKGIGQHFGKYFCTLSESDIFRIRWISAACLCGMFGAGVRKWLA